MRNQQLAAVRRLAHEAADAGLLSPELAAGISRVKGVKQLGFRAGNWLSVEHRTLSESARKRISLAQKKRWAKARNGSKPAAATASTPVKRTMSASARRKIAAAQRARWAKVRAAKKKAA